MFACLIPEEDRERKMGRTSVYIPVSTFLVCLAGVRGVGTSVDCWLDVLY